jgi:hypothetical protein
MIQEFFACVGERYTTRMTYKQSNTTFDEVLASRIWMLSEPTSAAGSGSHQSEGHSGDQTKDRAMISTQAEDQ